MLHVCHCPCPFSLMWFWFYKKVWFARAHWLFDCIIGWTVFYKFIGMFITRAWLISLAWVVSYTGWSMATLGWMHHSFACFFVLQYLVTCHLLQLNCDSCQFYTSIAIVSFNDVMIVTMWLLYQVRNTGRHLGSVSHDCSFVSIYVDCRSAHNECDIGGL